MIKANTGGVSGLFWVGQHYIDIQRDDENEIDKRYVFYLVV